MPCLPPRAPRSRFAPVFVRTSLKGGLVEQNILGALWRAMSTSLPASLGSVALPPPSHNPRHSLTS